jgi:DNA-binding IclR family transcriptional regulator
MAKTTMSTVDKALSLLRHFSQSAPELGLSELARLSGYDKTTTLRCLTALDRNGFVEQDEESRKYRIGLAPITLAQIREASFPVQSVISRHLDELSSALGETAHGTLMVGDTLLTAAISEPDRALYVHVNPTEILPWHATASGLAIASFLPDAERARLIAQSGMTPFTPHTHSSIDGLEPIIKACQSEGLAQAKSTFEDDVIGTAAPLFGQAGRPIGAIAVAAVALRFTNDLQSRIASGLRMAARAITTELGGSYPASYPVS